MDMISSLNGNKYSRKDKKRILIKASVHIEPKVFVRDAD